MSPAGPRTLDVTWDGTTCVLRLDRPEAGNAINRLLVAELTVQLRECVDRATVVVLEGLPDVFCVGADFEEVSAAEGASPGQSPGQSHGPGHAEALYDLWTTLATGPFISVAHVRGTVTAGGVGFVAACDIVLCDDRATFSLSELLFGLMPACVLPFLIRRIGLARANYLTATTTPIGAARALDWGLVDATDPDSAALLHRQLLRLRYLRKDGLARYKRYLGTLDDSLRTARAPAVAANHEAFTDPENLAAITRFVTTGHLRGTGHPRGKEPPAMSDELVALERIGSGVVQITMQDRVHKNTFTPELIAGLSGAFAAVGRMDDVRAVVLTGHGHYFASGGTKESLLQIQERKVRFTDSDLYSLALDCPVPVISAMQGHGIGGGFAMGLFADFVVLSQESIYTANFMRYGFTPGMGATLVLPRKLGFSLGTEMLMSARTYYGNDLRTRGVPFPVLPRTQVLPHARELASSLAQMPRTSLVTLKDHLMGELRAELPGYIDRELAMHEKTFHQPEVKDLIDSNYVGGN